MQEDNREQVLGRIDWWRVEFMAWKLMNHRHRPKSRLILNS